MQYSKAINIHDNAVTFVQLVVCLTSSEPTLVGFDPDYGWVIPKGITSLVGEVTVYDNDEEDPKSTVCELMGDGPLLSCRSIRGCGTACWKVRDKTGKVWLIKEAWVALGRNREYNFLKLAK